MVRVTLAEPRGFRLIWTMGCSGSSLPTAVMPLCRRAIDGCPGFASRLVARPYP
jgi:hypothetical protein